LAAATKKWHFHLQEAERAKKEAEELGQVTVVLGVQTGTGPLS